MQSTQTSTSPPNIHPLNALKSVFTMIDQNKVHPEGFPLIWHIYPTSLNMNSEQSSDAPCEPDIGCSLLHTVQGPRQLSATSE